MLGLLPAIAFAMSRVNPRAEKYQPPGTPGKSKRKAKRKAQRKARRNNRD